MKTILLTIITVLCVSVAEARIGETQAQITTRYGPALNIKGIVEQNGEFIPSEFATAEIHEKNGIYISVEYLAGRCASIYFVKKPQFGKPAFFTEEEVNTLLSNNNDGTSAWEPQKRANGTGSLIEYTKANKSEHAITFTQDGLTYSHLFISTHQWNEHVLQQQAVANKKEAEKDLSGF